LSAAGPAGAEDEHRPDDHRRQSAADVQRMIDLFIKTTGWRPARTLAAAGALKYSQYNLLIKFFMRRIARTMGAPIDTSRDYDFTDWTAVDRFAAEIAASAS
jgi:menaquinone-dependent protoporphyrinogen oxidase